MYGNKNLENLSIAFIAILIVALSLFEGVRITYPTILAYVDPNYFEFVNIAGDIYVEPRMPDREREALLSTVGASEKELSQFYEGLSSHPRMSPTSCATKVCRAEASSAAAEPNRNKYIDVPEMDAACDRKDSQS